MKLTAPIYGLRRQAKHMSRRDGIPLHRALNHVAVQQGYQSWAHLMAAQREGGPAARLFSTFAPGDVVLLGARPGQGKTLLGLELALMAQTRGQAGWFFTLDYSERDMEQCFEAIGTSPSSRRQDVRVDTSDDVSADYIVSTLGRTGDPAILVVDYLQILDQRRRNPNLDDQIDVLGRYAKETGTVCVLISQIDRSFDLAGKDMPDATDIRMPNAFSLSGFDKLCFLNEGRIRVDAAA